MWTPASSELVTWTWGIVLVANLCLVWNLKYCTHRLDNKEVSAFKMNVHGESQLQTWDLKRPEFFEAVSLLLQKKQSRSGTRHFKENPEGFWDTNLDWFFSVLWLILDPGCSFVLKQYTPSCLQKLTIRNFTGMAIIPFSLLFLFFPTSCTAIFHKHCSG